MTLDCGSVAVRTQNVGAVYCALRDANREGHDYMADACGKGLSRNNRSNRSLTVAALNPALSRDRKGAVPANRYGYFLVQYAARGAHGSVLERFLA